MVARQKEPGTHITWVRVVVPFLRFSHLV